MRVGRIALSWPLVLALLAGCARGSAPTRPLVAPSPASSPAPAAPAAPGTGDDPRFGNRGPDRMPIAVGNRWIYSRVYRLSIVSPSGEKNTFFESNGTITEALGCVDTMPSGVYAFQRSLQVQRFGAVSNTSVSWSDLRQDAQGLYEVKPPNDAVPTCLGDDATPDGREASPDGAGTLASAAMARLAPAMGTAGNAGVRTAIEELSRRAVALDRPSGAGPGSRRGESQLLAYPLRVGQRWSFVETATGHELAAAVVAHEHCSVPAGSWNAARIVMTWVGHSGPRDTIESWYGSAGLLRYRYHLQTGGDPGDPTFVIESDQRLTRLSLARNSRGGPAPGR